MKLNKILPALVLITIALLVTASIAPLPTFLAYANTNERTWQTGPFPPGGFQYARHDGAFVPGPSDQQWANKIYFPGGRTSPSTEAPDIWMFNPVTGVYTDTLANVVEDVSNYNANLILDDGTGRGHAIYVIGGTNKDNNGITIGTVQRYYPATNQAEALPPADDWMGNVGGFKVAAVGTAVVNDIIYVYGGWETNVYPYFSAATWTFDPKQPTGARWTNLALPMHTARSYIMSAVQDGKIYSIGGVGSYVGGELDPVDTLEVLDTSNLGAGWTLLAPMPVAGGEGRAYAFDSDTLGASSPWEGKVYVVAANDWAAPSGEVMIYDIPTNTWRDDLPELPTPRADLAGSFVPLCSADPTDGLPGLWTFGGRVNESCDPPLGPVEYYPLPCEGECIYFDRVEISGPTELLVGETGEYSSFSMPADASNPVSYLWNNDATTPETSISWDLPGTYTVTISAENCDDAQVVTDTLQVIVSEPCVPVSGAEISGPSSLLVGEQGVYTVTVIPGDATDPDILWNNGVTETQSIYQVYVPGIFEVSVAVGNCGGMANDSLTVEVWRPILPLWLPLILKP